MNPLAFPSKLLSCYCYILIDFNIFAVFQTIVLFSFWKSNFPIFGYVFKMVSKSFLTHSQKSLIMSYIFGMMGYSKIILYTSHSKHGIRCFVMASWFFFLLGSGILSPQLQCLLLLAWSLFLGCKEETKWSKMINEKQISQKRENKQKARIENSYNDG